MKKLITCGTCSVSVAMRVVQRLTACGNIALTMEAMHSSEKKKQITFETSPFRKPEEHHLFEVSLGPA